MKFSFLEGGGEMGALTRNYDWSKTALGTPDQWPQSLRTTISIILNSRFPMFLFWGPESICFYNDAYRPSLGNSGKHPAALGSRGEAVWQEIWPVIKPLIDSVTAGGEASWSEDQLLPIYRNGQLEDVYWTFSYSPVKDEAGNVAGVFVTCTETTEKVINFSRLAESKEQLEFAIEAAELGTWDLNPATGTFTANARLKAWFGLRPEEEIPLELGMTVIAQKDRRRVADAIATALQYSSGGGYDIEYIIKPPGAGKERIVKAKGRAWFGEDKVAYRFNGTLQDITAERKAWQDRANASALADLAVKSSRIGIFTITVADGQMEYTPEFAAILTGDANRKGLSREIFISHIHPDDEPLRAAAAKRMEQTGEFDYEVRAVRDDGSIHFLSIIGTSVKDETGEPVLFTGSVRDVTEQRTARQRLEEAEANMRGAVELAQLGTWSIDVKTNLFTASERLQSWFGFGKGEDVYSTGYNPIHEKDRERVTAAIAAAMQPGSDGIYDIEYTVVAYRSGRESRHHAQGKMVFDEAGMPVCLRGTAQDVTVQRELQLALEHEVQLRTEELAASNEELMATNEELADSNTALIHSNEELAQYAYIASHDLQEPLRKIRIFTNMLSAQQGLPEPSLPLIEKVSRSAARMSLLIKDLLDFSRLLKTDSLLRPVNLTEVMQAVASDFELSIAEQSAQVEVGELPVVIGVSLQMNQLFYNLLSNALKFTAPERTPHVLVSAVQLEQEELRKYIRQPNAFGRYYRITFADNGIGFETAYTEQIFEVFKRLHGRDFYPGSGIGLALCRRIVANHHGHLYAESEPGRGSKFHIILPDS